MALSEMRVIEKAGRSLLAKFLSAPWGLLMSCRRALYHSEKLKSAHPGIPVLSIGNISVGGTGKTPLTALIARDFVRGIVPDFLSEICAQKEMTGAVELGGIAILSRGYGRDGSGYKSVSRGSGLLLPVREVGDEAALLSQSCPGVQVAVCEDRLAGAQRLVAEGSRVILLDDAYQHLAIQRDVNLLVWDCAVDPRRESVFPFGRLREAPQAALDADILVFSRPHRGDLQARFRWFQILFERANKKMPACFVMETSFAELLPAPGRQMPSEAPTAGFGAFCGLGQADQFFDGLEAELGPLKWKRSFRDHHWYTQADLKNLEEMSKKMHLVSTWKDVVRMPSDSRFPLWIATQNVELRALENE
jgi:tetraacyldisaccharide 4'-kinase